MKNRARHYSGAAAMLAAVGFVGVAPGGASAATYMFSFSYDLAAQACITEARSRICYIDQTLPSGIYGNAGDVFNVAVTVANNQALIVPASKSANFFFVNIFDTTFPSQAQTLSTLGVITPFNYTPLGNPKAPPNPLGSPAYPLTLANYSYQSLLGFCCGYGVPNGGFSLTGANASLTLLTSDPNPLWFILVGTTSVVPETATWAMLLVGFGGLGAAMRTRRQRAAATA